MVGVLLVCAKHVCYKHGSGGDCSTRPGEHVSPRQGEQRLALVFSRRWSPRRLAQFRASERLAQARQVSPKRERAEAPVPDSRTLA